MRIEPNSTYKVSQKAEDSNTPSAEQVVKAIKSGLDRFETNPRNTSYEDIVDHFSNWTDEPALPQIVGKANAPEISDETLDKLKRQGAAQNKSGKKD